MGKEGVVEKPKHAKKVTEFSSQINRIKFLVEEKFKSDQNEEKELNRNPNNSRIKLKAIPKAISSKLASASRFKGYSCKISFIKICIISYKSKAFRYKELIIQRNVPKIRKES